MTQFKDNTAEGLDLRIDIRTNIGLLKNKINDIEEFRSKINDDLNKHISSLLNLFFFAFVVAQRWAGRF